MKQTLLALALGFGSVFPVSADPARDAIEATISGQIAAFGAGDFAKAFGFASDGIQAMFGTVARFRDMVEGGYGMVIAPADVQFRALREERGALVQRVLVQGADGRWQALDYRMVQQDGIWHIAGVALLAAPDAGV